MGTVSIDQRTEGQAHRLGLLAAARRSGVSPGTLVLAAVRGDVRSGREACGSLWFDRCELDAHFGVRSVAVELGSPFW